jgi:hypothetical protein
MTKEQFEEAKKKAGEAKMKLKEEDETHGTIETDDFVEGYFYNAAEGRLYLGPTSQRKTLAAYCAGDQIIGVFIMDKLSAVASKEKKEHEEKKEPQPA